MKKLAQASVILLVLMMLACAAAAQDAGTEPAQNPPSSATQTAQPAEAAPTAPAPVNVEVKPDPLIFKRTVVIDGRIDAGEWDPSFSADLGTDKVTAYADWDSKNLYFAVDATQPVKLTATVDAAGDGWFHGGDNYRLSLAPTEDGTVSADVEVYNSRSSRPGPSHLDQPISVVGKSSPDGHTIEVAMPQSSFRSLRLKDGQKIGLRLAVQVGDSTPIPLTALGDVLPSKLVASKSASLDPVEIAMTMRDKKVTPGQELETRLIIQNKSKEDVDAQTFVIGGEGRAAKYLNSEMIRIDGLKAGARVRRTFRSKIPRDMPLGSWGIGAEVRSAAGRLGGTLVSFEIAPPHEVSMEIGDETFTPGVYEWHPIRVIVRNNTRDRVVGRAKLILPEGWQAFKNDAEKMLSVPNEDGAYLIVFRVRLLDTAKPGVSPVKAEVTIGKEKLDVEQTVDVAPKP